MEVWKDVVGYEGLYQVSDMGNVRGPRGIMNLGNNCHNYCFLRLCKNKIQKYAYVHRLVCLTFLPNPENKPEVDHINGNKNDNRLINLRWATKSENGSNPNTGMKPGISGHRDIRKYKYGFHIRIVRNKTLIYSKCFKTLDEAIVARDNFLATI